MTQIYRVTIHGKILESRNLKQLLARAVSEKRTMDRRIHLFDRAAAESLLPLGHNPISGFGKIAYESPRI